MARTTDIAAWVKEHKATKAQVAAGEAKVCTRRDCGCGNVPLLLTAFYRDSSIKGGRASWCKVGEREYNAAYAAALKASESATKTEAEKSGKVAVFDSAMLKKDSARAIVRKERKSKAKSAAKAPAKATAKAKAKPKAKAKGKSTPKSKGKVDAATKARLMKKLVAK